MRCCFTGHRTFSPAVATELIARLEPVLERLYTAGVRDFRTGGALGFDTLAALRVIALRDRHPDCTLSLILPCRDQANRWSAKDRALYERVRTAADHETVLFETYTPECMHARNRALVDGSDYCVAYLTKNSGGTLYTCSYALKKGVELINLADGLPE